MKINTKSYFLPEKGNFQLQTNVTLTISSVYDLKKNRWDVLFDGDYLTYLEKGQKLFITEFGFKKNDLYLKVTKKADTLNREINFTLRVPSKRQIIMVNRNNNYFTLNPQHFDVVGVN